MLRLIRILAVLVLLCLAGLWGAAFLWRAPGEGVTEAFARRLAGFGGPVPMALPEGAVALPAGVTIGGPFALTDQTGRSVTEADYAGKFLVIYFGYTFCPDVCPTELGSIAAAMDELGPLAERVTPVFITIDPERDRPDNLADYVSRFHPRMVGLTGTAAQVAEAARRYRVYYAKAQRADMTEYLMDHSSFIYLVGPDGRLRAMLRPQSSPDTIAAALRGQLGSS